MKSGIKIATTGAALLLSLGIGTAIAKDITIGVSFDKIDGVIWYDGKLVPWADANVHVLTHGLHYASAVFEGEYAILYWLRKLEATSCMMDGISPSKRGNQERPPVMAAKVLIWFPA